MKYYLLLILLLTACNEFTETIQDEEIGIKTNYIIENKEYQISFNSIDTNYYLYCSLYSDLNETYKAEYYKFKKIKNKLVAKVKFNENIYKVDFYIAKKGKVIKSIDSKSVDILNSDSSLKKQTYLTKIYDNIELNVGYKLIDEFKVLFPKSLEIYPLKWKFETINKINKLDSLEKDLLFIEENYQHNGNYYFVQLIGNKLKGDNNKANMLLDSLQYFESEYFNNSLLYPLISRLLNVGNISKNNSSKFLYNIYKKNPLSLFTIRNITSLYFHSKERSMLPLYDTLLLENRYYYPQILLSKFRFLNFVRVDTNKNILGKVNLENLIKELEDLYENIDSENSFYFLKKNKYSILEFLDFKLVLNKIYSYHYLNGDYDKSIKTALRIINLLNENDLRLKFSTLLFIGDVYFEKLNDLNNAKKYYFLAKSLDIDIKDDYINKLLLKLFERYKLKDITFDEWVQINLEQINIEKKKQTKKLPKLLRNNEKVDLYVTDKKTLLVFTSKTCSVCKFVYKEINENKKWYSDKFRIIYISQENQKDLDYLNEKYNLNMKEISNGKELFDYFNIGGVPVNIVIDTNGKEIYKEEGASENWTLMDLNL